MRALKIAATGMSAQQMRVETISNNLANMNNATTNKYRQSNTQQLQCHHNTTSNGNVCNYYGDTTHEHTKRNVNGNLRRNNNHHDKDNATQQQHQ